MCNLIIHYCTCMYTVSLLKHKWKYSYQVTVLFRCKYCSSLLNYMCFFLGGPCTITLYGSLMWIHIQLASIHGIWGRQLGKIRIGCERVAIALYYLQPIAKKNVQNTVAPAPGIKQHRAESYFICETILLLGSLVSSKSQLEDRWG